jgi:hypothetical protein
MNRVGIVVLAALGFTLAGLGWCVSTMRNATLLAPGGGERLAGLALLVLSSLAIAWVFRYAVREPAQARPVIGPDRSEYRRGFMGRWRSATAPALGPVPVLVTLPRATTGHDRRTGAAAKPLPIEVGRLQRMLNGRLNEMRDAQKARVKETEHHLN